MKEEDIRPRAVFDEYLRLAALDAGIYFGDTERWPMPCPACGTAGVRAFEKHGFSYEECPDCRTLFVSPRPAAEAFFDYYQHSESARYFAMTFYRATAESRRENLWKPKCQAVRSILMQRGAEKYQLFDIGGGYGIFAEEYGTSTGVPVTVIEPGPELAGICRQEGLTVIQSFLEHVEPGQLDDTSRAFVSFELFEHLHDPLVFLSRLKALMKRDDMFISTTLSGTGVDLRVLWDQSKSVSLQHLNFFNPVSDKLLVERVGLEVLSITTPGNLDLDILSNNREKITDRFWRAFIHQSSQAERDAWQSSLPHRAGPAICGSCAATPEGPSTHVSRASTDGPA